MIPLALICIFFIWYGSNKHVIASPDKIIIHYDNGTKVLDKNSKDFNKIVRLTNQRCQNEFEAALDVVNNQTMQYTYNDGIGIEFVYSKDQTLFIPSTPIKYCRLYFQLTSNSSKSTSDNFDINDFKYGDKDGYKGCSIGILAYSKELVDLVKSIK